MQKIILIAAALIFLSTPVIPKISGLNETTQAALDLAQAYYGQPIFVTSAYRDAEKNKAVGGVPNSQHLHGKAIDIRLPATPALVTKLIWALSVAGFTSIGVYNTHIHADTRSDPTFWRG